jgi:hypothetical protein
MNHLTPLNRKQLVQAMRVSLFVERVREITQRIEEGSVSRRVAARQLAKALKELNK